MLIIKLKYNVFKNIIDSKNKYTTIPMINKIRGKLPMEAYLYLIASEKLVLYHNGKRKYVSQKPLIDDGTKYTELSGCIVAKCNITDMIQTNDKEKPYNYICDNITITKQPIRVSLPKTSNKDYTNIKKLIIRDKKR